MDEAPDPQPTPFPKPPTPGLGQPPLPATRLGAGNANAGWLTSAGGALVVLGVFLPWITVNTPNGSVSLSGKDASEWGFLLLGGFALARGLSMARPDRFHFRMGTPLIGGGILAVLVAMRWGDVQDALSAARAVPAVTASIGVGFWSVIAGTAIVLAGGVLGLRRGA